MSLNYENVGKNVIYNRSVDNIEDYVKGTIVGCYIGEDEEYYITSIESSGECIKVYDDSLIEIIEEGGGGVTVDASLSADSTNPVENKAIYAAMNTMYVSIENALGNKVNKPTIVESLLPSVTITPEANTVYSCGELTSLTIDDPGNIKYSIIFFSGATATTTVGIANFTAEANKRYRIEVENGYATYDSWPYTP